MYDIFYYFTEEDNNRVLEIKKDFPTAKFIKKTGSVATLINDASKKTFTKMFWLIPLNVSVDLSILEYKATEWDNNVVHMPVNISEVFLVPKKFNKDSIFKSAKYVDISFFKEIYDIVFISNGEENAEDNWQHLLSRFPNAKRIDRVKGIFQAHYEASKIATSSFFFVVDADAVIDPSFNFDEFNPKWEFDILKIWKSKNAVNGIEYGFGGVKLIPKYVFNLTKNTPFVDVTTSLTPKIKVMDTISNVTNFATSEFSTWRSAFRECVKLASATIENQNADDTAMRLEAWCTIEGKHPYGKYCVAGALAGKEYGQENAGNKPALMKINDYAWLQEQFKNCLE